ncbi:MAG TPA: Gfo/Idh/MocA family oxidoreductase [Chloroflexota bacterium]|nr:Gfo/Idh/MocA family oxidoreductase [Chloroflexota bacterium]
MSQIAAPSDRPKARVGVVGAGYWGPNLIRNLAELPGSPLAAVADREAARLEAARARYPQVRFYGDIAELLGDAEVNAVVLATPAELHERHALAALEAGKHVFVEKPLAITSEGCRRLAAAAERAGRVLMVGHTFLHNDAVRWVKERIDSGELGEVLYLYSRRLNLGQVRQDVNVAWNLAPHDVSIMLYLLGQRPSRVTCHGQSFLQKGVEDVALLVLEFDETETGARRTAHIHVSWLDPNKVREVVVVGSKKMVVYDDVDADHMIRVYDKGVDRRPTDGSGVDPRERLDSFGEFKLWLRWGDLTVPKLRVSEPLRNEMAHFVRCVETGERPLTDATNGLEVVKVLEAADESLRAGSRSVEISWE